MLLAKPIPKRESSGRLMSTNDVARVFDCSAAAVRQMQARGELEVFGITVGGIHLYEANYIRERAEARRLRPLLRAKADQALGFGRPETEPITVQRELPLREGVER